MLLPSQPTRNRVRDRLPLKDEMGRQITVPAYFGMKLQRHKMPLRVRGHVDVPIVLPEKLDIVLQQGLAAQVCQCI